LNTDEFIDIDKWLDAKEMNECPLDGHDGMEE
jgi:hypothetical protein